MRPVNLGGGMTPKVWVKATALAAAFGLLAILGYGQAKSGGGTPTTPTGTPPTGPPGTTPTNTGRTGTTTTNPTNTNNPSTTQNTAMPQPIFVSGRVTL